MGALEKYMFSKNGISDRRSMVNLAGENFVWVTSVWIMIPTGSATNVCFRLEANMRSISVPISLNTGFMFRNCISLRKVTRLTTWRRSISALDPKRSLATCTRSSATASESFVDDLVSTTIPLLNKVSLSITICPILPDINSAPFSGWLTRDSGATANLYLSFISAMDSAADRLPKGSNDAVSKSKAERLRMMERRSIPTPLARLLRTSPLL